MIDGDVPPGQLTDEFATLFNKKVIDVWELRHLLKSQLVPLRGGEVLLSNTQPRGLIPCRNTYRFSLVSNFNFLLHASRHFN